MRPPNRWRRARTARAAEGRRQEHDEAREHRPFGPIDPGDLNLPGPVTLLGLGRQPLWLALSQPSQLTAGVGEADQSQRRQQDAGREQPRPEPTVPGPMRSQKCSPIQPCSQTI